MMKWDSVAFLDAGPAVVRRLAARVLERRALVDVRRYGEVRADGARWQRREEPRQQVKADK